MPSQFVDGATEEDLIGDDIWILSGHGLNVPPMIAKRVAQDGDKAVADMLWPDEKRPFVKRHLLPSNEVLKLTEETGATHFLLLEGPRDDEILVKAGVDPSTLTPLYFGDAKIEGQWVMMWYNEKTGKDLMVHCPSCATNMAQFLYIMQNKWSDAYTYRKSLH